MVKYHINFDKHFFFFTLYYGKYVTVRDGVVKFCCMAGGRGDVFNTCIKRSENKVKGVFI